MSKFSREKIGKILDYCNTEISKLAPIHGVALNEDDTIKVDFKDEVTTEQIQKVNTFLGNYNPNSVTLEEITTERDRRIALGVMINTSTGKTFKIQTRNETDFRNIAGMTQNATLLMLNSDITTLLTFRDADDVDQQLNALEVIEMGKTVAYVVDKIYKKSWALKDRIRAGEVLTDISDDALWQWS